MDAYLIGAENNSEYLATSALHKNMLNVQNPCKGRFDHSDFHERCSRTFLLEAQCPCSLVKRFRRHGLILHRGEFIMQS